MGPAGISEVDRIVICLLLKARFQHFKRIIVRDVSGERDVRESLLAIGSGNRKFARLELDVLFAALQKMRSDLLALENHFVARLRQRRAADHQRARAIGAHAELHLVGVAKDDIDVLERHAEFLANDLREGGLVALAVTVRANEHGHLAGRMHAHGRAFVEAAARAEAAGDA